MTFQSTVNIQMGAGVPGDIFNDGPRRAESFILNSVDAAYNVFGRAFTKSAEGVAQAGNGASNLGFAGILINPKGSALYGTSAGGTLAPSITLANNAQGEIMSMGSAWVTLPAPASIGDLVVYNTTTGALSTVAPGAPLPVGTAFAQAIVDYFNVTVAGLAVITVSPVLVSPA